MHEIPYLVCGIHQWQTGVDHILVMCQESHLGSHPMVHSLMDRLQFREYVFETISCLYLLFEVYRGCFATLVAAFPSIISVGNNCEASQVHQLLLAKQLLLRAWVEHKGIA